MAILSIYVKKEKIEYLQILHTRHCEKRFAGFQVSQSVVRKSAVIPAVSR